MNENVDIPEGSGEGPVYYGNPIVGVWRCLQCRYSCFPRHLSEAEARPPFACPDCRTELTYDEEE